MNDFDFRTVSHLICRTDAATILGEIVRQHYPLIRRVLIVTDPGFLATGLVAPSIANLEKNDFQVSVFSDVVADPPESVVLTAVAVAQQEKIELVIGIGGGSSMDIAKLVAVLAHGSQSLNSMYGLDKVLSKGLPLIQIPTTAGTGSEVTPIAIVTTGATSKMGVVSHQLYADIAILDAKLTLGLPPKITAATGIDAMVHAIEAYTTRHKKNPISDMLAKQALSLLWTNIERACTDGNNIEARQAMLLGAMLAGQSFANAPCAGVHALAYPIGGIFHVPHGLSNSLVLPHVLRFNSSSAVTQYAELAHIIAPAEQGSAKQRTEALIHAFEALALRLGIGTRLRDVGIADKDITQLASEAMLQTRLLGNNPKEISFNDAIAIYSAAL
jgi:alcohol dehydrogenase